jgi:KaiC/GvpD/RAD55 family RecA-like ATPase
MGLPVEVPGLDTIIAQVPDGHIVVVESGADGVKSFFARRLARTALRAGRPVTYLTSRDGPELSHSLVNGGELPPLPNAPLRVVELDTLSNWDALDALQGVLVVDSFSYLTLTMPVTELADLLRRLRALGRSRGLTTVLATDRGMADERSEAILGHLSDGCVQFLAKEGPEGLIRFLRVPKWAEGTLVDRNIYYDFDGKRLAIDLWRRVL